MRRVSLCGIVAALLPVAALAQMLDGGFEPESGFDFSNGAFGSRRGSGAMWLPLTRSGQGFDCTGATSCVSWDGSALVETAGLTWAMSGTVPQSAGSTLPTTASSGAAGPFSDANYYSNGSGSDALDSTGDRWGCVAFVPSGTAGQAIVQNGSSTSTAGHFVAMTTTTGTVYFRSLTPTAANATTANSVALDGFNTACWWRTGTAISVKLNLGTTATNAAAGTEVAGTAYTLKIGRYEAVASPFTGKILHVVQGLGACPTPPAPFAASCEGFAVYQMSRQFGLIGTRGEQITFVRATTATNEVNGVTWNVPSGVPRVTTQGLLVERATTNAALQSGTICTGAAATAPWTLSGGLSTCLADQAVAPDGTTAMDQIANTGSTSGITQPITLASTTQAVSSMWMRRASSGTTSVITRCVSGTVTGCTCSRPDGGTCTPTTGSPTAADCIARFASVGTTPVRGAVSATCSAATTSWAAFFFPGDYSSSTGTAEVWGAQVETGLTPTSYQPTAGTAVARNADVATVAAVAGLSPTKWSVSGIWSPYGGRSWNQTGPQTLWATGTLAALNTAHVAEAANQINVNTYDGAAANRVASVTPVAGYGASESLCATSLGATNALRRAGAIVTGATSGAGTGMAAWNATIRLGSSSTAGQEFDGYIRDFRIYRSTTCR